MDNNIKKYSLGIIGGRGFVGIELQELLHHHPSIELQWVSTRQLEESPHNNIEAESSKIETITFQQIEERKTDIIVLALPNGLAQFFVKSLEVGNKHKLLIDLSADFRFDKDWIYSLPELDYSKIMNFSKSNFFKTNNALQQPIKISNPGCYATAMQLILAPVKDLLSSRPHCFGVSGYSGAGTKPCPNNDPDNLKNNLIGYSLVEHIHEKEVSFHLQHPVSFSPHVAQFFRGINMTTQIEFYKPQTSINLYNLYNDFYSQHPFVLCQKDIPTIQQVINTPNCVIGGITVSSDGKRAAIVGCLDNLLKGAASQALQNINIALGFLPSTGLNNQTL